MLQSDLPNPGPDLTAAGQEVRPPQQQIAALNAPDLAALPNQGDFALTVSGCGGCQLRAGETEIFQINLGRLCNMSCRHCHVAAGPQRRDQVMDSETVELCLSALDSTSVHTVDITGGAPELNSNFRYLLEQCVARGKHVIDRCNLTVLLLPQCHDLPEWLAERAVEMVCSLPDLRASSTDAQRGDGTFSTSITALKRLNQAGYGKADPERILTLMVNPVGAHLAANQGAMECEWKQQLRREHGVTFDRLIALNNMPIARYLEWLQRSNQLQSYLELLVGSFCRANLPGLMCTNTVSVSYDGRIFDCDFNQMLDLESQVESGRPMSLRAFDPELLRGRPILTGRHCFGCTAGAGSSCSGALTRPSRNQKGLVPSPPGAISC